MNQNPNSFPVPYRKLRLVTDPGEALSVLAMPTKFDAGYPPRDRRPDDPPEWEPNWGIENRFTVSLRDALTHRWDSDAHVVCYLRSGCTVQRRLNKDAAPAHWIGCDEVPQDCDDLGDVFMHAAFLGACVTGSELRGILGFELARGYLATSASLGVGVAHRAG